MLRVSENSINSLCSDREDVSKVFIDGLLVRQEVLGSFSFCPLLCNAHDGLLERLPGLHAFFLLQMRKEEKRANLVKIFVLQALVEVRKSLHGDMRRPSFPDLKVGDANMSGVQKMHCKLFESKEGGSGSGGFPRADAGNGSNAFLGGNLKDPNGEDVLLMPCVGTGSRNVQAARMAMINMTWL